MSFVYYLRLTHFQMSSTTLNFCHSTTAYYCPVAATKRQFTASYSVQHFIEFIVLGFQLKLWRFDDENANLASTIGEPFQAIDLGADRYLECLASHPTTDNIIAVGSGDGATIVDLQKCAIAMGKSFCNPLYLSSPYYSCSILSLSTT